MRTLVVKQAYPGCIHQSTLLYYKGTPRCFSPEDLFIKTSLATYMEAYIVIIEYKPEAFPLFLFLSTRCTAVCFEPA